MKNASFIFMNLHCYCRRGGAGGWRNFLTTVLEKEPKQWLKWRWLGLMPMSGGGVCRGSSDDKSTSWENVLEMSFGFNHKSTIMKFRSRHLVLWFLENHWFARILVRDWLCKGNTHDPLCTLSKVSYIVVWLLFQVAFSVNWSCLRFKINLFSWESLYLIGLNPTNSKIQILALHLFFL
jgi:hypothetical protein